MPTQMEFEGKDVELAVKKASKKLNQPVEKLKYTVISYGSTGIFGLVGAKKARIRVNLPDDVPARSKKAHSNPVTESDESFLEPAEPEPPKQSEAVEPEPVLPPEKIIQVPDESSIQAGKEALERILDAIATDTSIIVQSEPGQIVFNISCDNPAPLIGNHGQTLEAIQYLIEKIVNRQNDDHIGVQVDVADYLKERKENLRQQAERLAEKAKRTGKPASAGQLNSHDRRVIHLALKDDTEIRTQSIGEGPYRKLMIFPKKKSSKKPEA